MTTQTKLLTVEDLLAMPDDGFRYELVRGELRQMPPAKPRHGRITMNLSTPLDVYARAHKLGPVYTAETGFLLAHNPDTIRAPDVSFVRQARVAAIGDIDSYWPEAPALVAEVVSPSDRPADVLAKALDWLQAGTEMVIVINPRQHVVTVYRSPTDITTLTEADVLDGADVVPGWALPVQELFV